jgi:hypothetical protein
VTANWLTPSQCYPSTAMYGFDYTVDGSDQARKLSFDAAMAETARTIRFQSLNLFVFQDAWASISIERNKYLVPSETEGNSITTRRSSCSPAPSSGSLTRRFRVLILDRTTSPGSRRSIRPGRRRRAILTRSSHRRPPAG